MIRISDEARDAIAREVAVALETTLVAHGFPPGEGVEVGIESERQIRAAGAVPATIGVLDGEIVIGLTEDARLDLAPVAAEVVDTTGAGDALAAGVLLGGSLEEAARRGLEAAARCVSKVGALP